jgi:uncharacterized protein YheU (UPF0270 family)
MQRQKITVNDYIEIPLDHLSDELLNSVVEEYITREGTDYGLVEFSLEQKVAQVKKQLSAGHVIIVYDPVSESCTLIRKE